MPSAWVSICESKQSYNHPNSKDQNSRSIDFLFPLLLCSNIRRIIFSSISKFDGTCKRMLSASELKQIAGRAGRFGSIYPKGKVTGMSDDEIKYIEWALKTPLEQEHVCFVFSLSSDLLIRTSF